MGGIMAKAPSSSRKLKIDYLVIKCSAPFGLVSLGVLGTIRILSRVEILFFVGDSPKTVAGLDAFEMKLVAAAPNAVREDLNQLTSQHIPPDKLLDEVSHRYRGTIFASERTTKEIEMPMAITSATSPQQIFGQVASAIMQLAKNEKIALAPKRKTRRRAAKTAARSRPVQTDRRQLGLPQQFGLTMLHM
jgi:hypothetical protein